MGSIDSRLNEREKKTSSINIERKNNLCFLSNQYVLDVRHVWRADYFRKEHNTYSISNRYNWHIQHENLNKINISMKINLSLFFHVKKT